MSAWVVSVRRVLLPPAVNKSAAGRITLAQRRSSVKQARGSTGRLMRERNLPRREGNRHSMPGVYRQTHKLAA